jgi:hypothetical protein
MEEVVRQSKGGRVVEGKHGAIFRIVDRRRRGRRLSGGTGVHVLHRGDLINDRVRVFASLSKIPDGIQWLYPILLLVTDAT